MSSSILDINLSLFSVFFIFIPHEFLKRTSVLQLNEDSFFLGIIVQLLSFSKVPSGQILTHLLLYFFV